MESIGKVLRERPGSIVLFGHTDGRAYRSQTPDNWRLSWARAQMAYYMLTRAGVPEARFGRVVLCKSIPQRSRASARRGKSPHRNSFEHPKTLRTARSRSAPDAAMKPSPKPSSQRSRPTRQVRGRRRRGATTVRARERPRAAIGDGSTSRFSSGNCLAIEQNMNYDGFSCLLVALCSCLPPRDCWLPRSALATGSLLERTTRQQAVRAAASRLAAAGPSRSAGDARKKGGENFLAANP